MTWFLSLPVLVQGLLAGMMALVPAAFGAAMVFPLRDIKEKYLDGCLGLAGGIMMAASFYSLLNPAYGYAEELGFVPLIPIVTGFCAGVLFLIAADRLLPTDGRQTKAASRIRQTMGNNILMYLAMTVHNIPEGLAIGVAVGAAADGSTMAAALALALGIGIQNFPEGAAISLPLRRDGFSPWKAFGFSQLSAVAETLAAMAGAALTLFCEPLLPFVLSFAAGAMIFVVFAEIIPEAHINGNKKTVSILAAVGFGVMMFFDLFFS
ncbi:MAG: ZIP family metal transporter [Firmicutes bacterium]|nr:ZIP family metal transporter [Bacillota bacterium]